MTEQELMDMKLHDKIYISNDGTHSSIVRRVIGGWIYGEWLERITTDDAHVMQYIFVPEPKKD